MNDKMKNLRTIQSKTSTCSRNCRNLSARRKRVAKGKATTHWLFASPPHSCLYCSPLMPHISTKFKQTPKKFLGLRTMSCMLGMWKGTSTTMERSFVRFNPSCLAFFHVEGFEGEAMPLFEEEGPPSSNFLLDIPRSWGVGRWPPLNV